MKKAFYNQMFDTNRQTTDLFNLLDELRDKAKKRHKLNILVNSK